ncbi:MAG: ABC transporter transmembrane domain-containing protein [Acidimicrobiales bacterium]
MFIPDDERPEGYTMADHSFLVEITGPTGSRTVEVRGVMELGRESTDLVVEDPSVSRLHLRLDARGPALTAEDLGSSNGSFLEGAPLVGVVSLRTGDRVRIGDTHIRLVDPQPSSTPTAGIAPAPVEPAPPLTPSTSRAGLAHPPDQPVDPGAAVGAPTGPAPTDKTLRNDSVEVRYSPNTYGEGVAKSYAATAVRARRDLAGLGSEPWGTVPVVHLIDPYHDGVDVVTSGSIIDPALGEAWVVVTGEAPPEDPHGLLAVLFGAALPNAQDLALLIEGFGLHRAGLSDPDAALCAPLPQLAEAEGELRGPLSLSFVRFLISKEGEDGLLRLVGAPAGRVDEVVREVYGAALGQLEMAWRRKVLAGEPEVKTGEFLRMSLKYLRPYKMRQVEIFGYMLLSLAFVAAFPFVTRRLFDTALPSGEFSQVMTLLVGLGIAFVISLLAGVRQTYQTAWVSGAVTRDIRQSIFARVQRLPATWYREHPQGDVLSRLFSDVGVVQNGLSSAIGQGVFQMISLLTTTAIMLTINLWLGLLVLAAAPLVALVYQRMSAGARDRSLTVQEDNSALLSVAAESYQADPVVKMFGLAAREERRFGQQGDRLFRSMRRLQLWGGLFGLSVNLIMTALRLTVLGVGA